jgi:hypothetical protein
MAEPWVEETVPCIYAPCDGLAEPEMDGDMRYYACMSCGGEFGYQRVQDSGDTCQLGLRIVPEQAAPVFIGSIGRRPE